MASSQPLRAAVVGLTGIAARRQQPGPHTALRAIMPRSHVEGYVALPHTDLVAVCELKQELIDQFRDNWNDVLPDVTAYTDYNEMIERENLDLISVVTSDHFHHPIVAAAAAAGIKGIVCEKPLATTLADADQIVAACTKAGTVCNVDHTRRWYASFQAAREAILDGTIGEVRRISAHLAGPRAMLARNGTHTIDSIRFFSGAPASWVFCELEAGFEDYTEFRGDGKDPGLDPACSGYIHFANDVRATVDISKDALSSHYLLVKGEKGEIELQGGPGTPVRLHRSATESVDIPLPDVQRAGIAACIDEVTAVLDGTGDSVSSPVDEARDVVEIMIGFLKSHTQGNVRINCPIGD